MGGVIYYQETGVLGTLISILTTLVNAFIKEYFTRSIDERAVANVLINKTLTVLDAQKNIIGPIETKALQDIAI